MTGYVPRVGARLYLIITISLICHGVIFLHPGLPWVGGLKNALGNVFNQSLSSLLTHSSRGEEANHHSYQTLPILTAQHLEMPLGANLAFY